MMDELQTIKLRSRFTWYLMIYGIGIWLLVIGFLFLDARNEPIWLRLGVFILLVAFAMLWTTSILAGQPYLKLTTQSIESRAFWFTHCTKWTDIVEIKEYAPYNELCINYVKQTRFKIRRNGIGFDNILGNKTALQFEEFRDLVISYWKHAKKAQALQLSKQAINPSLKTD
jgi:hypothetical protein